MTPKQIILKILADNGEKSLTAAEIYAKMDITESGVCVAPIRVMSNLNELHISDVVYRTDSGWKITEKGRQELNPPFTADNFKVGLAKQNIISFNPMDDIETLTMDAVAKMTKVIELNNGQKSMPKVENKQELLMALNQMLIFVNEDYAKDLQQVIGIIGQLDEVES